MGMDRADEEMEKQTEIKASERWERGRRKRREKRETQRQLFSQMTRHFGGEQARGNRKEPLLGLL